jgi:membrane protease YdiL (CAAX protease family)
MDHKIPVRFFVVTFAWTWLFFVPLALMGIGIIPLAGEILQKISLPLMVIAAFGPAAGACVSLRSLNGKGAIKIYLRSFLSLRFGWKVWLAIFAVPGISSSAAWLIPELFGETRLPPDMPVYMFPPYLLLMIFFGGGQEEIGWRGYILPFLEEKFGLITGSLMLGILWAIWHIPLWFIPGTSQSYTPFFGFMLITIGYSYFFSWIREASGRRLFSGPVVHGAGNAFAGLFPFLVTETGANQIRYWIYAILTLIIGILVVVIRTYKRHHAVRPRH